ncbi:hypothetical protein ABK040_007228 [Willaertia magna]
MHNLRKQVKFLRTTPNGFTKRSNKIIPTIYNKNCSFSINKITTNNNNNAPYYDNQEERDDVQIISQIPAPRKLTVVPSIFEQYGTPRPPTISFITAESNIPLPLFSEIPKEKKEQVRPYIINENFYDIQPYYKLARFNYNALRFSLLRAGFKRIGNFNIEKEENGEPDEETDTNDRFSEFIKEPWNVFWGRHLPLEYYQYIDAFQKVNHFPGSANLGRKDLLFINLFRQKEIMGSNEYDFFPDSYLLPYDHKLFMKKAQEQELFILKPFASSCGRGISVWNSKTSEPIPEDRKVLVQEYIHDPLLIGEKKFDMRLYVVVSSFNPLRVYLHCEGLTRFATESYDMEKLDSVYSHLTNYSLNKKSASYVRNMDENDEEFNENAHKWSIAGLQKQLRKMGYDVDKIWGDIESLIVKTLISVEHRIQKSTERAEIEHRNTCFELYGFDVMIDKHLKPWLIEVNIMPSLAVSSLLDKRVKVSVLSEMFHVLGITPYSRSNYDAEKKSKLEYYGNSTSAKEKYILHDSEDELARTHHFKRIYPPLEGNPARYEHLFAEPKPFNTLLVDFEKERRNTTDITSLHRSIA